MWKQQVWKLESPEERKDYFKKEPHLFFEKLKKQQQQERWVMHEYQYIYGI